MSKSFFKVALVALAMPFMAFNSKADNPPPPPPSPFEIMILNLGKHSDIRRSNTDFVLDVNSNQTTATVVCTGVVNADFYVVDSNNELVDCQVVESEFNPVIVFDTPSEGEAYTLIVETYQPDSE